MIVKQEIENRFTNHYPAYCNAASLLTAGLSSMNSILSVNDLAW